MTKSGEIEWETAKLNGKRCSKWTKKEYSVKFLNTWCIRTYRVCFSYATHWFSIYNNILIRLQWYSYMLTSTFLYLVISLFYLMQRCFLHAFSKLTNFKALPIQYNRIIRKFFNISIIRKIIVFYTPFPVQFRRFPLNFAAFFGMFWKKVNIIIFL